MRNAVNLRVELIHPTCSANTAAICVNAILSSRARLRGLRYFAVPTAEVDLTKGLGEQMAHEGEANVERFILFSDGVVAIAITLLILPLTEIHPAEHATLADIVVENSAELGAFALSFAVIANFWTIHNDFFRPLRRRNGRIVLLNMFWLAAIVFLPFPTALIADGIDGGFAALYIGTLLVVSVLNLLIANYLAHHPELTDGAAAESRQHVVGSAFAVGAILIALIISLFSPSIGLFGLLLLIPAQVIAGRVTAPGRSNAKGE